MWELIKKSKRLSVNKLSYVAFPAENNAEQTFLVLSLQDE